MSNKSSMPGDGLEIFDKAVSSVRDERARLRNATVDKRAIIDGEWERAVQAAEALKLRVGKDPRVKAFSISRRLNDVMITVKRDERSPPHFIRISRQHPDQNYPGYEKIWLRETGHFQDRQFEEADLVVRDIALSLAHLLA
ncbi:MAG: hypothetical protein ACRETN_00260 [Nevskiales bacterium]